MLHLDSNVSLKPYNTFGIDVTARYFAEIKTESDLETARELTEFMTLPRLILGGGSNVLFTRNFDGLVIKLNIQGISVVETDEQHVWIQAGAGVVWHDLVIYCVENNFAGMENLSLIPGTVGAAPMQNIGAYGVEIEQIFDSLTALHIETGKQQTFSHDDCQFGYRESVFKHVLKNQYIITSVTFRLNKQATFYTQYGAIQETLAQMNISDNALTIKTISDAVIQIRRSKLPDPAEIGNAGSFFKNPEILKSQFETLKINYPALPGYAVANPDCMKIPAGWLIEQAGWKGYRRGDAGVHAKQALVLVNYGRATGAEIITLAKEIQASVQAKFGVMLSPEVNWI
jgi:UDP-N-acetylmuramate dehydrogenase